MNRRSILIIVLFFMPVFSALAHRLNEYLQATTIVLTKTNISFQLHLTAGSDIAKKILKEIDTNGDGILSSSEQQIYAQLIVDNLSLSIDNREESLRMDSWRFPTTVEIINGVGDIILSITAGPIKENSTHRLLLTHKNQGTDVVYLVNCLVPADHDITVVNQIRNTNQSVYQLDFTIGSHPLSASADQQRSIHAADRWAVIRTYFFPGVRHIITGYDHLLFLCALVLGAASLWDLIKIVTAFTVAHSITLALATYGLAHLPEEIVEPVIAASIIFVAVQNIVWPKQSGGNSRLAIAFFFGLFHGLGFAGGLLELMHAMPTTLIIFAIVGFSLGVEVGNQLVLIPLYFLFQWLKRKQIKTKNAMQMPIQRYASGVVAIAGIYYLCIDLFAFH